MIPNTLPPSLADNDRVDRWIGFEPGGRVRISTGKVELGQGVLTALAQLAADELDVAPERIRIVSGETGVTPDEGYTAGSLSIEHSGGAIRLVCADVRASFVARVAAQTQCREADVTIADGRFLKAGTDLGLDYWSLAPAIDLARSVRTTVAPKPARDHRLIGQDLPRIDLPAKVFGTGFIHDRLPAGVWHARVLRRPWRGARLAIDREALARALPGIEIVQEGDFLAVLATDETAARNALDLAARRATWSGGDAPSVEDSEPDALRRRETRDRVVDTAGEGATGPAVRRVEATYAKPFIAHASIGPSCALASFENGRLTVETHSQGVTLLLRSLSVVLGLPPEAITVRHVQGAGCYGHNGADDAAFDAAFLATRLPGRTIRVLWSREDELGAAPFGSAMVVRLAADLDADGRPSGWTHELWSAVHGRRPGMNGAVNLLGAEALPNPPPEPEAADVPDDRGGGASRNAVAIYDLPGQRMIHHLVPRLPVRTSSMRGLGGFANVFAIESFVDELAAAAGRDPVAYRLALLSEPRARRVVEQAATIAGWDPDAEPGTGRGRGIALARYKNRAAWCAVVAEVEAEEDVRVTRVWSAVDCGLVINPSGIRNQIEGGIVQGASWTLKEAVRFEDGRVASNTWETYPILRFSEIPEITVDLVDRPDAPPLGVGEASQGPTAAAIANALAHALGIRVRELPLTRERIAGALMA